jgi:hypothetical protein
MIVFFFHFKGTVLQKNICGGGRCMVQLLETENIFNNPKFDNRTVQCL